MKAIEADEKGRYGKLIDLALPMLSNDFINLGISKFQDADFAGAVKAFETTLKIGEMPFYGGAIDTTIMFNAGLAAYNGELYDVAIKHFNNVKDLDYGDFTLFILLKNSYVAKGDSVGGLKALQEGFTKFPDNESVLIELINFYIMKGGDSAAQEALDYIGLAKEQDPTNASYYHAEGILYDKIGKVDESITSYEKALELNPDYFDSNYNLGAHHFNKGVNKVNECNEIMDNNEYQKCKEEADAMFEISLPYMEKAHELNPEDISTIETLKLLYYRMKLMDKHDAMDAKLKELKGGI
jgi:tetratricopeptide (TPR) repeat protein